MLEVDCPKMWGRPLLFLSLKKKGTNKIRDFRPISLIRNIYKILTKVWAGRLQKVLPSIISHPQGAFVHGRQILDGVLVANDRVNGGFLACMLRRIGFGERWINWIQECLSSTWFSILINRTLRGFFPASRGLRQGEPLSPFLFLIEGEAFNQMTEVAVRANLMRGFSPVPLAHTMSHLQFIDDTIIFCEAHDNQIKNVKAVLWCFEGVSGLNVNFTKSEVLGIRVGNQCLRLFAYILGCEVGSVPTSYLRLPLCTGRPPKLVWNPVMEKVGKRPYSWKANYLSLGGTITLIQAILTNLLIYFMSF